MIDFSVVIPVHNEAEFLPYSLPSVYQLNPSEVVLLFDRCTDNSEAVARKIAERWGYSGRTRFVPINDEAGWWTFRIAYLRRLGFSVARHNFILSVDADMILDPEIKQHFPLITQEDVGLLCFEYLEYPISFRNLLKRFYESLKLPFPWLSGVILFSRQAMIRTEPLLEVMKIPYSEDTFLHDSIRTKYRTKMFLSKCLHLRPRKQTHYFTGQLFWKVAKRSFLITILNAVALLRLSQIKGYIHERWGKP